jgi:hypothetical protein
MVLQQAIETLLVFIALAAVTYYLGRILWRSCTMEEENTGPNHSNQQQQKGTTAPVTEPRIVQQQESQAHGSEDITLSMAVSAATGSTVIGYVAGGSLLGAIAGVALAEAICLPPADTDTDSIEQTDTDSLDSDSSEPDYSDSFDD